MKRNVIVLLGLSVLVVAVGAYAMTDLFASGSWRYKMTVTVETPEGEKTGSAVREVTVPLGPELIDLPEAVPHPKVKGEAVVVDLGTRGKLFAIMRDVNGPDYAHMVVYKTIGGSTSPEGVKALQAMTGQKAILTQETYPMMVMFKDITDPKSVTPVLDLGAEEKPPFRQYLKADHFEELFGVGVKLKEITIEITNEPVTWGVKKYRPSYGEETGFIEWFRSLPYGDPRKIGPNDFYQGEK